VEEQPEEGEDGVAVVGEVNVLKLPHMRPHCTKHPLPALNEQGDPADRAKSRVYCELCYCFVCDVLCAACREWEDHCIAVDRYVCGWCWCVCGWLVAASVVLCTDR
jgi:hypothetical protein